MNGNSGLKICINCGKMENSLYMRMIAEGMFACEDCYLNKTPETLQRVRRPGRNSKCKCGSGKKYKNCCLNQKEVTNGSD